MTKRIFISADHGMAIAGLKPHAQSMEALRAGAEADSSPTVPHHEQSYEDRNVTMTYWRLHYHLIWATFERQPILTIEREKMFYGVIYQKAKELDLKIHASGSVNDHIHIVVSVPPKLAVADCVRHLKGASAYAINHMDGSDGKFKWQEGYGALTVGERSLPMVMSYANNQKEHHKDRTMIDVYERIDEE